MKRNRLIFYGVFALFHIGLFLFTLYVDGQKDNIQFLLRLQKNIWLLKYGSFVGLGLLIADAIWHLREERDHIRDKDKQHNELTSLKAKLFDLQEASKEARQLPGEAGKEGKK